METRRFVQSDIELISPRLARWRIVAPSAWASDAQRYLDLLVSAAVELAVRWDDSRRPEPRYNLGRT